MGAQQTQEKRPPQAAPGCVWRERSNQLFRYCCSIRNCRNKRRNGRCGLPRCHLEYTLDGVYKGRCQDHDPTPE